MSVIVTIFYFILTIGILVLRVDSAEEAQSIYDNDPAVIAGIGYTELHPFRVGMYSAR